MTFPRVHHADYFSDSGPVDGTVLVNSHSDAIEALQAGATTTTAAGVVPSDSPADPQVRYDTTSRALFVYDPSTASWYLGTAPLVGSGSPVGVLTPADRYVTYLDTDSLYEAWVWDGSNWYHWNAPDALARFYGTAAQPLFGTGTPTATSAPVDGSRVYYFDNTSSPYVAWVFDGAAWQQDGGSAAASTALPYRTGGTFYYSPPFAQSGNLALTQNKAYATPYYVPVTTTFVSIGVVTTGTASATTRLGIYSDNNGVPGALVLDAGNIATATSGFKTITISQSLTKGWYWLTAAMQGAAGSLNCSGANQGVVTIGVTNPFSSGGLNGYSQTGVSGALPSPWGGTYTEESRTPIVYLAPA